MTLTELAFVLFFLLLLLSAWQLTEKERELGELADPGLQEKIRIIKPILERVDTEDFVELVNQVESGRERDEKAEALEKAHTALRERVEELQQQLDTAEAEAEECSGRLADARGQVKHCQRRVAGGLDHPPCWADSTGKVEFLYRVVLRERELVVEASWPPHRDQQAATIPGVRALPGTMELSTFARRAQPILEWSQQQEPECRHFVRLADQAETKDGYKDKRIMVENFFYKYEESRRSPRGSE